MGQLNSNCITRASTTSTVGMLISAASGSKPTAVSSEQVTAMSSLCWALQCSWKVSSAGSRAECLENSLNQAVWRWWWGPEAFCCLILQCCTHPLIWGMFFCSLCWLKELEFAFTLWLCTGPDCYHQKGVAAWLLRNSKGLTHKGPFKSL